MEAVRGLEPLHGGGRLGPLGIDFGVLIRGGIAEKAAERLQFGCLSTLRSRRIIHGDAAYHRSQGGPFGVYQGSCHGRPIAAVHSICLA